MTIPLSEQHVQAFFLCGQEVRRVAPGKSTFIPLPESLIVPPGAYAVFGQNYELHEEGLYRFICPMAENRQCIVFQSDVWALMSAVCWLVSHGYRDNGKTVAEKKEIARRGKLIITCGDCSEFSRSLFQELQIPIRQANIATLLNHNDYNDGHVLTEVKLDGRWIAFDPDQSALYSSENKRLNILELIQYAHAGGYQRERLAANLPIAVGHFTANNYQYELWSETCLSNDLLYDEIMNRLMGIPIISENGVSYFTAFSENDRERAEALYPERSLRYLSLDEFRARFYDA
jgi:hypothetical protein